MKKLLSCFLLIIFLSIAANARAKYWDFAKRGGKDVKTSATVTHELMETFPLCTVTVYVAGTSTLATIYSDNAGTVKANPFTADAFAYFEFYADDGFFDIRFSGTGIATPFTRSNILLFDPLIALITEDSNYIMLETGTSFYLLVDK